MSRTGYRVQDAGAVLHSRIKMESPVNDKRGKRKSRRQARTSVAQMPRRARARASGRIRQFGVGECSMRKREGRKERDRRDRNLESLEGDTANGPVITRNVEHKTHGTAAIRLPTIMGTNRPFSIVHIPGDRRNQRGVKEPFKSRHYCS